MQTANLKLDIISWISSLKNEQLLQELYLWVTTKEKDEEVALPASSFVAPARKGKLTDGFNIWGNEPKEDLTEYRKKIWQTERSSW